MLYLTPSVKPPIYVAVVDSARSTVAVLSVSDGRLRQVAVDRHPSYPLGEAIAGLATDGRRVVTLRRSGRKVEAWVQRVTASKLGGPKPVAGPPDPADVQGTGDGRFLVAGGSGEVAWILPYRPAAREAWSGGRRVSIGLTRDRAHFTAYAVNWLTMGESSWTSFGVGRLSGTRPHSDAQATVENGAQERGVLYLPARREAWTFDGGAAATVWRVNGKRLVRAPKSVALPTNGRQAVEIRPGLLALWDAYGGLSLARMGGVCRSVGPTVRLPKDEVGNAVELRVARDGSALVVASSATGSLWTVPILHSRALGTPKRLFHAGRPCAMALSY